MKNFTTKLAVAALVPALLVTLNAHAARAQNDGQDNGPGPRGAQNGGPRGGGMQGGPMQGGPMQGGMQGGGMQGGSMGPRGMGPGGMGPGGNGTAIAVNGDRVFVIANGFLIEYSAKDLKLVAQVALPKPVMPTPAGMPPMPGGAGRDDDRNGDHDGGPRGDGGPAADRGPGKDRGPQDNTRPQGG